MNGKRDAQDSPKKGLGIITNPFRWLMGQDKDDLSAAELTKDRPWYEGPGGSCNILQPTLLTMGENNLPQLMYPVHWSESVNVLPEAKQLANEHNALLVLLIYGEASESEVASLIVELAEAQVLPLWIGEGNRKKLAKVIAMLSGQTELES